MTGVGACGLGDCPVLVPSPLLLRRLRTVTLGAGMRLHRGHRRAHPDATVLAPGVGNTRFAPLDGSAHTYLATTTFAGLLESSLHEAAPPEPRIYRAQLAGWQEREVTLRHDVRLADLRDQELGRLGVSRSGLVATDVDHYPCTRVWAETLRGRKAGGHPIHGILWHSRQRELHARQLDRRPALRDLVAEAPAEVLVLWSPPAPEPLLDAAPGGLGPLSTGPGLAYLEDLAALLSITVL